MGKSTSNFWSSLLQIIIIMILSFSFTFYFGREWIWEQYQKIIGQESPVASVDEIPFSELPIVKDTKHNFLTGAKVISDYALKAIKFKTVTEETRLLKDTSNVKNVPTIPQKKVLWNPNELEKELSTVFGKKKAEHMHAYLVYVWTNKDIAKSEMKRTGIAASITLAQGLLEGNAGRSFLAKNHRNHFGIKCKGESGQVPQAPYAFRCVNRCDDSCNDYFNSYESDLLSYQHHSWLLQQGRYRDIFSYEVGKVYVHDGETKPYFEMIAKALKKAGYATSPRYAEKLTYIIETYQLYLVDYELLETLKV